MTFQCAFLDIGHGDCTVLTFPEHGRQACIVIDGGQTRDAAKTLATYLNAMGVQTIDLLVVTHIDADHIGGLIQLLRNEAGQGDWIPDSDRYIKRYWGPLPSDNWVEHERTPQALEEALTLEARSFVIESVAQNQDFSKLVRDRIAPDGEIRHPSLADPVVSPFASVEIDLLAPDVQIPDTEIEATALLTPLADASTGVPSTVEELERLVEVQADEAAELAKRNANNQSIVLRVTPLLESGGQSEWSFLLTGDAEQEAWAMMRSRREVRSKVRARVLKLPHHGSWLNGIDAEAFDLIDPAYCVNSAGQKHGLPDAPTLNLVRNSDRSLLFCTERNNHDSHPGPCPGKRRCPRRSEDRWKSLRFTVDLSTDSCETMAFDIARGRSVLDDDDAVIWCPETSWR